MKKDFLGTGWKFPLELHTDGSFVVTDGEEDIREAILIILNTSPGERVMRPEFGCGIHNYVFSVINVSNLQRIADEVRKALIRYEPRISIEEVRAAPDDNEEGRLLVDIDYVVHASNSRYNMVYPFYLTEKG